MDRFVSRENIKRYRKLASKSTDAAERSRVTKLPADEEAKIKLELRRTTRRSAKEQISSSTPRPEKIGVEYDREGQRAGG